MSIVYSDPDIRRLERSMNRIFDDFCQDFGNFRTIGSGTGSGSGSGSYVPIVDVNETDKELVVHAELPGVPKENVNIDIRDNSLVISGKHEQSQEYKQGDARIRERRYGSFARSVPLPPTVKHDNAKARFENGVLEVRLLKGADTSAKKITIS